MSQKILIDEQIAHGILYKTVNLLTDIDENFTEVYGAEALNTAKVTNATHTGDATGNGALTLATVNANVGTFNNATVTADGKGRITAISTAAHTGDATGATALTLATVNATVGTFTNATVTVNAKGLVTAAATGASAPTLVTTNFRIVERATALCIDQILTPLGFLGAENTDWVNLISWAKP